MRHYKLEKVPWLPGFGMNGKRILVAVGVGLLAPVMGQAGADPAPVAVTFDDLPLQVHRIFASFAT